MSNPKRALERTLIREGWDFHRWMEYEFTTGIFIGRQGTLQSSFKTIKHPETKICGQIVDNKRLRRCSPCREYAKIDWGKGDPSQYKPASKPSSTIGGDVITKHALGTRAG